MKPSGPSESRPRLIVGISGASGAIYGVRLLQTLRELGIESHLILSRAAEMTISYETDLKPAAVKALADVCYPIADLAATLRRQNRWKMPDALQAALAKHHKLKLATRDTDDFPPKRYRFVTVPYTI